MLFTPQHTDTSRYTYPHSRPRLAVKTDAAKLLKVGNVFTSGLYRQGSVYLFTGRERILSMRPEYAGELYPEYKPPTYYRANVFNEQTGVCRLVDLTPNQMVKVVG